ncbi:MAG: class I SAM-dependent methyltransferase [Candidatus Hodarchaeota archaeon]
MKRLLKLIYTLQISIVLRVFVWLNRLGIVTFYQPLPRLGVKTDAARTARAVRRWEAIKQDLNSGPMSVLDIGCNVGFYSIKLAELGHFVTGIDNHLFYTFAFCAKEALGIPNLTFSNLLLTPKNIKTLPNYDCTLLLSVFHHWCVSYGTDDALQMLDDVYKKTNRVLFFETAQEDTASEKYRAVLPDMGEAPEIWLHGYFRQRGCRDVRTICYIRGRYLIAVYK